MKKRKNIGSSFEKFLEHEGIQEEVNIAAVKSVITRHLKKHLVDTNQSSKKSR